MTGTSGDVVLITGSAGLVGSEAAAYYADKGLLVVGVDNDMRAQYFGRQATTRPRLEALQSALGKRYRHYDLDIRDAEAISELIRTYGSSLALVIHAAGQPSHDWSAEHPVQDFQVNAVGTLNLLQAVHQAAPQAVFIFTSTNKVYGDHPNQLPLQEKELRWELPENHKFFGGIDESMSLDRALHSPFGASKLAADVMVQEFGRYYGLQTACFRGGCMTGPHHAGAQLHGFLSYLMRCTVQGTPYTVYGHKGKQVRDNIHSRDLVRAIDCYFTQPRAGEVYNMGGGRHSNCSMLEAIDRCQEITGRQLEWSYQERSRIGDHIWWISGLDRFQAHYPEWELEYDVDAILEEIYRHNCDRWQAEAEQA